MLSVSGRISVLLSAGAVALIAPRAPGSLAALTADDLPAAIAALLELGLLTLAVWVLAGLGLACLRGAPGRIGRAAVPAALLAGMVAAPAQAEEAWPLDGLPLPQRPLVAETTPPPDVPAQRRDVTPSPRPEPSTAAPASPAERPAPAARQDRPAPTTGLAPSDEPAPPTRPRERTVAVVAGDSLWSIARSDLGPRASTADVAGHVRTLHRLNRDVVGPDPDLIVPGQHLHLPHEEKP